MPSVDEYTCTLDKASLKVAQKELNEDPKNRAGAVETLRKWITEQPHIKFTTDFKVLLAFLRYSKFSQLKVRETIEKFCTRKTQHPELLLDLHVIDKNTEEFIRTGFFLPLPGYDKEGRRICYHKGASFQPENWKHRKSAMFRAMFLFSVYLTYDERTQVNGAVYFCDFTGLTVSHTTFWPIEEIKLFLTSLQNTFPTRYKCFYHYNVSSIWEAFMTLTRPFLGKKFQDRMLSIGSNLEKVYKFIPRECLPLEYLPDDYDGKNGGNLDLIIDNFMKELTTSPVRDYLALISNKQWLIDAGKKDNSEPQASFRKLNID